LQDNYILDFILNRFRPTMQLKKIQEAIDIYKTFLKRNPDQRELFSWESQNIFQKNWDIEAPDFGKMYDNCLQNSHTRRWWTGDNFKPKARMLEFINQNSDFVRAMFRALFDESKPIENRISKFQFGCEVMMQDFKEDHPTSIENNHYHLENHVISMYLSFRYPSKYPVYFYPEFASLMKKIGSTKIPERHEMERFFKITKTLTTFLHKDAELISIHQKIIDVPPLYQEDSMLLVTDFYRFIGLTN